MPSQSADEPEELLSELRSGTINFDDKAMQLITSYTDKKVREARLDEWSAITETLHSGILAAEIHVHDIEQQRIAELTKSKDKEGK